MSEQTPQARLTYGQEERFTAATFADHDTAIARQLSAAPAIDAERAALLLARAYGRDQVREPASVLESLRELQARRVRVAPEVWASLIRRNLVGKLSLRGHGTLPRLTKAGRELLRTLGEPR